MFFVLVGCVAEGTKGSPAVSAVHPHVLLLVQRAETHGYPFQLSGIERSAEGQHNVVLAGCIIHVHPAQYL